MCSPGVGSVNATMRWDDDVDEMKLDECGAMKSPATIVMVSMGQAENFTE
jgi:hypothetical protein